VQIVLRRIYNIDNLDQTFAVTMTIFNWCVRTALVFLTDLAHTVLIFLLNSFLLY
jgi:hypothetical protein